jgi:hypothetical protein
MTHYIQILKDTNQNNYLGIIIPNDSFDPYLVQLKEILGDSYDQYVNLQQTRDGGKYHMTFINVNEFNKLSYDMGFDKFSSYIDRISKVAIDDIRFIGLGTAEKSENKCFFVVCASNTLQETRGVLGLEEKDFHVTIGFKWKDVHGVSKNEVLVPTKDFQKKLKMEYMKSGESFEFIKGLKNFDLDVFKLIEPIKINDTNAIFRCGDNDYIQVSMIDDRLTISGKWQDTNKLPILSDTLVERKFKQIN